MECVIAMEKAHIKPEDVLWNIDTRAYGKVIPGILNPKSTWGTPDQHETPVELDLYAYKSGYGHRFALDESSFTLAHNALHRWFRLSDVSIGMVPEGLTDAWLGAHYRGTDKQTDTNETDATSIDSFIVFMEDMCQRFSFEGVFICSDSSAFIDQMGDSFHGIPVMSIKQERSSDERSLHMDLIPDDDTKKFEMALVAMADTIALSQCGHVLKCSSALSAWAKVLQPRCQLHQVAVTRHPWFPVSVVPMYQPASAAAKKAMGRS